jgi:hypothetical protein
MKTSLAIAAAALMSSAILSLTSGVAAAGYDSYSGKSPGRCGVVPCPSQQQTQIPTGQSIRQQSIGPYRGR